PTKLRGRPSPVLKALSLLQHVARATQPITLTERSAAARLPKPTTHRLAARLERAGLVAKDALTRRYVVGAALVDLGFEAIRNAPGRRSRRLILERLSEKLGEAVNLAVLGGDEIVYLDRVEAAWPLRMDFKPGSRVPLHCTATGKLLLAHPPAATREKLLRSLTLTAQTPRTMAGRPELEPELARIRQAGSSE